jgi:hypothetical protein
MFCCQVRLKALKMPPADQAFDRVAAEIALDVWRVLKDCGVFARMSVKEYPRLKTNQSFPHADMVPVFSPEVVQMQSSCACRALSYRDQSHDGHASSHSSAKSLIVRV